MADHTAVPTPPQLVVDLARSGFTLASTDDRRDIWELNSPELGFSIQYFVIKARIPLGKHAHTDKSEVFKVITGSGKLLTCPVSKDEKQAGKTAVELLHDGSVIYIPPHLAHTFYLEPGTTMICFSSSRFDPKNMDFTPYPWLVEENLRGQS